MARAAPNRGDNLIDLTFDSDEDSERSATPLHARADGFNHLIDLSEEDPVTPIDLTELNNIPDYNAPPSPVQVPSEEVTPITETECLQNILNVFPDIAVDYVTDLVQNQEARTTSDCERLITKLLDDGTYPKERDEANQRKRKRGANDEYDFTEFETGQHGVGVAGYRQNAINLLRDEFLDVPMRHIERIVDEKKTLFDAYIVIKNQLRTYNTIRTAFSKVGRPRTKKGYEDILAASGNDMPKELRAAQKKLEFDDLERRKEEEFKAAEEANLLQAQINGEMNDCQCCFDEFPFNRMVSCGGNAVHLFCRTCAKTYVEGEIGVSKCRPVCFADRDCGGTFSRAQLLEFLPQTSFDRLEHLQQQEDLRTAGLDFLEECPFCDFKAECLPADVDKEFRCENPKCGKTSCRLCQKETHIPMSCEEAKKDESLNVRHTVEEAKSAALIRHCNRCKNAFVKLDGCNKMTCTKCRNTQCYVCSKNVTNYDHFGNGRNRCPLHDNHEARHEQEVEKAEQEALAKIRAERPDISEEHLKIEVSDRVKQAEQSRLNQAQAQHQNFPFHMNGDQLVAGHIPPPPPPPLPPAQPYPVGLRPPPPQLGNQGIVNFAQAFRPRGFHFFPRPLMLGGGLLPPAPDFGAHAVYRFGNAAHLAGFEQHVAWEELLNLGGQEQPNPMREEPPNLMGQGRVVGAARDPPHGRR